MAISFLAWIQSVLGIYLYYTHTPYYILYLLYQLFLKKNKTVPKLNKLLVKLIIFGQCWSLTFKKVLIWEMESVATSWSTLPQISGRGQWLKLAARNPSQVSHVGSKNPVSWAVIVCLPGSDHRSWALNPSTAVWGACQMPLWSFTF